MGRIPRDIVDAIRDRSDIVEVVGRHVGLQRRGGNWIGLCPFHQEKTPSFNVVPSKGIFHCFGCQAGGDVFKFLMMLEGLSFIEAVRELAGPAGVTLEERELTPAERMALRQRASEYELLAEAASFFESRLWTSTDGEIARKALADRGISRELAKSGGLGYAPDGWTRLLDHLHAQGFPAERVAQAGLARPRKNGGGFYDAFRHRLIIPIRDERGRTIAFGGRILEGDGPKYINSPETRLYEKSKVLYGMDRARSAIGRNDRVLVVEGYFDVLSLQGAGFEEAIATCGTALTPEHLQKIRRMTRNVIVLMDSDEAGSRAAERTLPMFIESGIFAWRLQLPGAKDPDELIREEGPEAMEKALESKEPLIEWVVRRKIRAYGGTAMSREQVIEDLLPLLHHLPGPLLDRVAQRLDYSSPERLYERIRSATPQQDRSQAVAEPAGPSAWRPHVDITHLLWLLVHRYDQVADLLAGADPTLLDAHQPIKPLVARLLSGEPAAAVLPDIDDRNIARTLAAVVARDSLYAEDIAAISMASVLDRLDKPRRTAALTRLTNDIQDVLKQGDMDGYRALMATRAEAVQQQRDIEGALQHGQAQQVVALLGAQKNGA